MADEIPFFNRSDIDTIRKVVKRVQSMPLGVGGGGSPAPVNYGDGFYAKITGKEDPGYLYSWRKMKFSDYNDPLNPNQLYDFQSGRSTGAAMADWDDENNHYAVEALTRSSWIPIGSVVYMRKVQYQPYYVFEFTPRICLFKVGSTAIPAYSSPTWGYRDDCKLYKLSADRESEDTESNKPVRLYNRSSESIDANTFVWAAFTYPNGQWQIISQLCD